MQSIATKPCGGEEEDEEKEELVFLQSNQRTL
jgi:hypothetical protein